jgi:hypothetical protein
MKYSGLTVDARTGVKDVYDALTPNLFATGDVIGRVQGQKHIMGAANGKSAIFL